MTAALTLAEVLWPKGKPRIPSDDSELVERFFQHEWIVVRETSREIAEEARALIWNDAVPWKDAIHLATALSIHRDTPLDQFDTYDKDDLWPLSERFGSPPLKIGPPGIPGKLPL